MPVKNRPSKPSDIDISTNEALLHHADASRLAKSWLSGVFGDESSTASLEDEQDDFDKNVAQKPALYSDTGGIGYTEPTDATSSASRASDPATAFLRKQMLGRGANQHTSTKALPRPGQRHPHPLRRRQDDDEDEEEGRSGLGKSKASKHRLSTSKGSSAQETNGADDGVSVPLASENAAAPKGDPSDAATQNKKKNKKRGSSYLDEILASRVSKKNKKTSGKGDDG